MHRRRVARRRGARDAATQAPSRALRRDDVDSDDATRLEAGLRIEEEWPKTRARQIEPRARVVSARGAARARDDDDARRGI